LEGGGNVAFAREVSIGNFTTNLTAKLNATLTADADIGFLTPSYVFTSPVRPGRETDAALLAFRDWLHGEAERQRQLEADLLDRSARPAPRKRGASP
jgi:hypothetical protein